MTAVWVCAGIIALGVAGQLLARWRGRRVAEAALKLVSSALFLLAFALATGGEPSSYGQSIGAGLAASWLGDALLIGQQRRWVALGLLCFLVAHILYLLAAAPLVDLARVSPLGLTLCLSGALALGAATLGEARPRLGPLLVPATLYTLAVGAVAVVAVCAWLSAPSRSGRALLGVGGVLFLISDVAVARQRFVRASLRTRLWGLPSYYAAQILLAASTARL